MCMIMWSFLATFIKYFQYSNYHYFQYYYLTFDLVIVVVIITVFTKIETQQNLKPGYTHNWRLI